MPADAGPAKKDIVDTAIAAGSLNTLVTALQAAGLADALKGKGPFTVFAPTDDAFSKLPAGTFESLLKPENKDKLVKILTYHVVPGNNDAKAVMSMSTAKTVEGGKLTFTEDMGKIKITDEKGGTAWITTADVFQSNGVAHVIDTVLMPS